VIAPEYALTNHVTVHLAAEQVFAEVVVEPHAVREEEAVRELEVAGVAPTSVHVLLATTGSFICLSLRKQGDNADRISLPTNAVSLVDQCGALRAL